MIGHGEEMARDDGNGGWRSGVQRTALMEDPARSDSPCWLQCLALRSGPLGGERENPPSHRCSCTLGRFLDRRDDGRQLEIER